MQVTPKAIIVTIIHHLVGGFNPFEKIWVKMGIFPNFRGEKKNIWVATTKSWLSFHFVPRPHISHILVICLKAISASQHVCLNYETAPPCPNSNCLQTINVQFICIHSNFIASCNTPSHKLSYLKSLCPPTHCNTPSHKTWDTFD